MNKTRVAFMSFVVIVFAFTITLILSCNEMGLSEDGGPAVSENALETSCVCRVDGDVDTSGKGTTWETAKKTVEECVSALEPEAGPDTPCEVWVKGATTDKVHSLELGQIGSATSRSSIKIYGGFKGNESSKRRFSQNGSEHIAHSIRNRERSLQETVTLSPAEYVDAPVAPLPQPNLLAASCSCNGNLLVNGGGTLTVTGGGVSNISDTTDGHIALTVTGDERDGTDGTFKIYGGGSTMLFDGNEQDANSTLFLNRNSEEDIMMVDNGGDVGIGNLSGNNPLARLHVYGDGSTSVALRVNNGKVGIGVADNANITKTLTVNGTIRAEELIVEEVEADFVFDDNYPLRPLESVDSYIISNHHLPGVPSAKEFKENEIGVGATQKLLLQKIEELTLYAIEQEKRIKRLEKELGRGDGNRPRSH